MSLRVTTSGTIDATLSLMTWAASSDSKRTIATPESSFRVQYPATNPGACDTPGTTFSRRWLSATSWSLIVTVTTTARAGQWDSERDRCPKKSGFSVGAVRHRRTLFLNSVDEGVSALNEMNAK